MELGSKVSALEEEIAVLKGEIKTILQEVRTAVLARENPFAVESADGLRAPSPATQAFPEPSMPEPEARLTIESLPMPSEPATPEPQATVAAPSPIPFPGRDETDAARYEASMQPAGSRRWSAGSLATLIAWTQETASRMDASDLDIVLSLARYGGLIDEELETTLTKLSKPLFKEDSEPQPKGVTDYLLALRELSALIEEAEDSHRGTGPLRRAS